MLARQFSSLTRLFAKAPPIRPLGSRVLIELDKAAEKVGSLYLPQSAQQQTNRGTILAVGPGAIVDGQHVPIGVKVGERVILPSFGGQVVKLEKNEFTIIEEAQLLATIS
jgi:chaperonin GroES